MPEVTDLELCQRCNLRPITNERPGTSDRLCGDCLAELESEMNALFRVGGALMQGFLSVFGAMPKGVSGELILRTMVANAMSGSEHPEAKALVARMRAASDELERELPGGRDNPGFASQLEERWRRLPLSGVSPPGGSA